MIHTAALLNDLILPKWPVPADPFLRALWADQLEHAAYELARLFNEQFHTTVSEITAGNLTSPDYELRLPTIPVRRIDTGLLLRNLPTAYTRTAYLRATDAEHIIGRTTLYELCRKTDPDRTASLTRINIGDIAKILSPAELDPYLLTDHKPARPVILRREQP
jgi:hypothetical protein